MRYSGGIRSQMMYIYCLVDASLPQSTTMKDIIIFIAFLGLANFYFPPTGAVVLGPGSWAVLVSGGKGWGNYAMQADICHAYHVMLEKGVKKENIITMMFDDIAQNRRNPYKGSVFNCPGCPDVYKGVTIDYSGKLVTHENFLNVLLGKESEMKNIGSGKVLKSGINDTVFINFSGHGGQGYIIFPSDLLPAKDLIHTLHTMKEEKRFGKLVLYLDSCFCGSMFDNLIEHFDNVFAITAAATDEPSYSTYCVSHKFGTCMAGLFEISWMDRLEQLNTSETIFGNYDAVRTAVKKSHVQMYGDYKLGLLEEFISGSKSMKKVKELSVVRDSPIPKREVQLYMAKMEALNSSGSEAKQKWEHYKNILKARHFVDNLLATIMTKFTDGNTLLKKELESERYQLNLGMFDCYTRIVSAFNESCFPIYQNTYLLDHLYKFSNICIKELDEEKAVNVIRTVCKENIEQIKEVGTVI